MVITVSQINRYIKYLLEGDKHLTEVYVRGELSNCSTQYASGHRYFTLGDANAAVRCVMFSSYAKQLRFQLEDGLGVIVRAKTTLYERTGAYQLEVTDVQPEGAGALALAFAQCKAALEKEGLFDTAFKKPLPPFPKRVGIVTSQHGAALQDILSILSRRYPLCTAVVCPALVQGDMAPASLIEALKQLDKQGCCDLIIIGRGGGSAEDLWSFNHPDLARAVFGCKTPVISAVGHETDFTICDLVADLRAPTPSAAAEMAVPDIQQLTMGLYKAQNTIQESATRQLEQCFARLESLRSRQALQNPMNYIIKNQEKL